MRVPVSVLIPVKNEINNLPGCLDAIKDWADEIVVVDSASTDGTIECANAAGAVVMQFRYKGGWPKKRQWAMDRYRFRNDWILLLDADEVLLDPIKDEIREAIRRKDFDGYRMRLEIVFLGRQLKHGASGLLKLNLFRKGKGRFERRLREQDLSMGDVEVHEHIYVDGPVGLLRNVVRHENLNSIERYIEKHNAYSNWSASVFLEGEDTEIKPRFWGYQAERRRWLVKNFLMWPLSPLAYFLLIYIGKLGFLDGKQGFIYSAFQAVQLFHTKTKIHEARLNRLGNKPRVCEERSPAALP